MAEDNKTIKISELPELTSPTDNDVIIVEDEFSTKKIILEKLVNFIKNHINISNYFVHQETVGQANGVTPLDSSAKIPSENIPFGNAAGTVFEGSAGKNLIDHVSEQDNNLVINNSISMGRKEGSEIGMYSVAIGQDFFASGQDAVASGICSVAIGSNPIASGEYAHAHGFGVKATEHASCAIGERTTASGRYSYAQGVNNISSNTATHAEGMTTVASGISSHSEGGNTKAIGNYSHAEGNSCEAQGEYSHAEGGTTKSIGSNSHAEGSCTESTNFAAHAEGNLTKAKGSYSHSEGTNTEANGDSSHAEGSGTMAVGGFSHAQGLVTIANGFGSHAEGVHTIASADFQHVEGKYNIEDTEKIYAHIVGGGSDDSDRRNIHTLDWNGNATFAGSITDGNGINLGGLQGELSDLSNEINSQKSIWADKYTRNEVDNKFSALETAIDWKEAVNTYDDLAITYPTPEDGWTVNVKDTDYTYRWSGTEWVIISANAIPKATASVDGLLTKEDKALYDDANTKKHTHANKTVLDEFTQDNLNKLNGIEDGANNYVLTKEEIISKLGYEPGQSNSSTLEDFGVTVSSDEINYLSGATGNIQTQLNNKAQKTHVHNYAASSTAGGAADRAINDSNGNPLVNEVWSNTEPVNQNVDDYWNQEYE